MNTKTIPSKHPYHHVIIAKSQKAVTLCILNANGEGGFDHWKVDKQGHKRVSGICGNHFMQDYWMDYLPSEVITNIYKVLDFYVGIEDNKEEELDADYKQYLQDFCPDDIPF